MLWLCMGCHIVIFLHSHTSPGSFTYHCDIFRSSCGSRVLFKLAFNFCRCCMSTCMCLALWPCPADASRGGALPFSVQCDIFCAVCAPCHVQSVWYLFALYVRLVIFSQCDIFLRCMCASTCVQLCGVWPVLAGYIRGCSKMTSSPTGEGGSLK